MKTIKLIGLICIYQILFLLISNIAHAKDEHFIPETKITVHVTDENLLKQNLVLVLKRDEIYINVGADRFVVGSDKNGDYTFVLPRLTNLARFSMSFLSSGFINDQFIEPGDNIRIEYSKNVNGKSRLIFSGKGSAKLTAYYAVLKAWPDNYIKDADFSLNYLNDLLSNCDSLLLFKKRVLDSFKDQIEPTVYQTIEADIFAGSYVTIFRALTNFYIDTAKRDVVRLFYSKVKQKDFKGSVLAAAKSNSYVQTFLISKAKASAIINSNDGQIGKRDIYNIILELKDGIIKEKLLMCYFLGRYSTFAYREEDTLLTDNEVLKSLNFIKSPDYRKIILDLTKSRQKGSMAYTFNLPDTTGKMISLKDFKNKVVMIDCWFTGCSSCVRVSKIIDNEVLPVFVNDSNVVFVSVNVDRNKELWKKSIKSGRYTNSKSINLYTEGLELNHPFIKNYHFQGFPHVILIDRNGQIFSSEMPREGAKMIELINDALKTGS